MKKVISIFLILLCCTIPIFSHLTSLSLSTYNDAFTMGIGENYDDLRSYGFFFTLETDSLFNINIALAGITSRNNSNPSLGSRIDEIEIVGSKEFVFYVSRTNNQIVSYLNLQGGFFLVGNLGFESIQNIWHRMTGVNEVYLPYCGDGIKEVYPEFRLYHRLTFYEKIPYFSFTQIAVEVDTELLYSPTYISTYSGGLSIGQLSSHDVYLKAGAGFTQTISLNQFPLLEKTADSESGIYVKLSARLGLLKINYWLYPHSRRTYGGVGLSFYNKESHENNYYRGSDIIFSLGSQLLEKNMISMTARYAATDSLGVYISNAFGSETLENIEYTRQNSAKWNVGLDYQFVKFQNRLMIPFISFGGGIKRILVSKDSSVNTRLLLLDRVFFLINSEIGLRFFHDGRFKIGSTIYGLEISAGVSLSSIDSIEEEIVEYNLILMDEIQPYVKISLFTAGSL